MNILVLGTGYVGTTTALALSEMGWHVTGLDMDSHKVQQLLQGKLHFYEPGLEPLLQKHLQSDNITFTTQADRSIQVSEIIFICVGTPPLPDGSADLHYVKQAARDIGRNMNGYKLIIIKSTVPIGTQEKMTEWVRSAQRQSHPFDIVSNPEFLREGKALSDALHPDRIVIGATNEQAAAAVQNLYLSLKCPVVITTPRNAELIKYAANAFLAMKISFINEMARLCDKVGINIKEVAQGIGLDPRIGNRFLQAGIGYGGSCFPKDVAALLSIAAEHGTELKLLKEVVSINETQHLHLMHSARTRLGNFMGTKIAVLGLAFKPDTDDIRESSAIRIVRALMAEGAQVAVHDPVAKLPPDVNDAAIICSSPSQALENADAVFLCTEWTIYQQLDWVHAKQLMKRTNIFDGRNVLDAKKMAELGYFYQGVGYR